MKRTMLILTLALAAIALGIGLIIAADEIGWLPERTRQTDGAVSTAIDNRGARPATLASSAATPSASANASPASATTQNSSIMRAQRPPSPTCTTALTTITLASPAVAEQAGLRTERVTAQPNERIVVTNAEVAFAGDHYAHLSSRAPGIVAEVQAELGDEITAGDVLAIIESAELGSAKASLLQARSLVDLWEKNLAREQSLLEQNVGTAKEVLEAETHLVENRIAMSNASQRLRNLGFDHGEVNRILAESDTSSSLPLRAPFDGIIVERNAVQGEVITSDKTLFAVTDPNTMWVMLDVYEGEVGLLQRGQTVELTLDGFSDRTFAGELTWISARMDPQTRTIKARAEVPNDEGLLRANAYGRARIMAQSEGESVMVPAAAVQWDGCCNVVFVKHTETIYQPYKVTLGERRGDMYVVKEGLPAGEGVVTDGSFLLKTEILKGNIGAGCCEVDPGATSQ